MDIIRTPRRVWPGRTLLLLLLGWVAHFAPLHAQPAPAFDRVEYYFDTDPGYGLGTAIALPATPGTNLNALPFTVDLTPVSAGFHTLFVRSRAGADNWSQTHRQLFYKEPATATAPLPAIVGAEYFIDADPGYGLGTAISIAGGGTNAAGVAFTVPLGSVAPGFHALSVRSRDANGAWSQTYRQIFYVEPLTTTAPLASLAAVEYFVDADPGYGLGQSAPIAGNVTNTTSASFTLNLGTLAVGFHTLYYRVRDADGKYSQTHSRLLYVDDPSVAAIPNINKAEYFFDADPGYGLGRDIPIPTPATNLTNLSLQADASGLADGQHRLSVRVRDANGGWSQVLSRAFAKSGCNNSPNFAADQPSANYSGSGITAAASEQMFNGSAVTGGSSTFLNNYYAQVDLGATTPRTISQVLLSLQNVNGTAVNYTLTVETSTNLSTWTTADTYSATLPANMAAPLSVTRTLASPLPNVRGVRLRLTLPSIAQGIRLTDAGVYFFPATCPVPVVLSFTPTSGPAGTVVTVTGTDLDGATAVTFNGVAAGAITNNTAYSLTVSAPVGGTDGQICVTTPGGTACSSASYLYPPAIATGPISGTSFCTGNTITVPFSTNTARYAAGNTFGLQLSDASGVFAANAPVIGTLQSINATGGVLTGVITQATPAGGGYRVRVVATNPAVTGADNGANLTIGTTPVSQATGPASVANGAPISLSSTPTYAGATYAWTGPGGFSSTLQSPTTSTTTAGTARYSLTVTLGNCTHSSFVDVNVLPSTDPILTLTAFSGPLCVGAARTVSFSVSGNPFPAGNTVTAQLSDASGAFTSPVSIGSVSFSGQGNGALTATIPAGATPGAGYRVRLVGSNPSTIVSNDNGSNITLNALPTVTVSSNSPVASGGTIVLNGGPAVAGNSYVWTVQYTSGGSATVGSTQNLSLTNATTSQSGNYTLTITNAAGCSASASTPVTVNAPVPVASIQTSALSAGSYCAGTSLSVPFTASNFTAGNVFTAQLSDASGSFASPVSLGTLAGTGSGSIAALLPTGTAAGSGYRIRVVGSSPATIGSDNGTNLSITPAGVNTWLGAVSSSWTNPANWSCGLVPDATSTVVIPGGLGTYPVLSGPVTVLHLTLMPGSAFAASSGVVIDLKGNLVNNGTLSLSTGSLVLSGTTAQTLSGNPLRLLNLTVDNPAGATLQTATGVRRLLVLQNGNLASNGNLTLESDATGTAMVVNTNGVVTGLATARRYVDPALNPGLGYRHFASPVSGPTVADLHAPGAPAPVVNPAYNTSPTPMSVTPFPTVFGYDESRLTAANSGFDAGWASPALGDLLPAGRAYTVNLAPATLEFAGTLRTGSQSVSLTRGGTANSGWHLLGNPYPAPLNWDNVARPAGLDNALYTYRSTSQYSGAYVAYVNGIGPAGANLVALGQGFFARVSSGAPTLTFTNAARETSYASPAHYRSGPDLRPRLELALQAATATGSPAPGTLPDVLYVYQEAGATAGFDAGFDAVKVQLNGGTQPSLYQQAGPESLSIQGLPTSSQPQALPLGVSVPAGGTFVFDPQVLANFGGTTLWLEDRQTGTWHDLRTGAYRATLAPGLTASRFVLHLNPAQGPLATAGARLYAEMQLYPNPAAAQAPVRVQVQGQAAALLRPQLEVLSSLGQRVYQADNATPATGGLRYDVPTAGLAAGVYTVRLTTATGVLTRKLVVE